MKIRHTVEVDVSEVEGLFNPVMQACVTTYPTAEEQAAAILAAKQGFTDSLNDLLAKALRLGKKLGKKSADSADDVMYSEPSS